MVDKDLKEQIHKHHIIPKHVGGSDNPSNLVKLTRLEHAWVHWLMWCDERKDVFNLLESKGVKITKEMIEHIPFKNKNDNGAASVLARGEIDGIDMGGENHPRYIDGRTKDKEYKRGWQKEYDARPEVIERKQTEREIPEAKAKKKEYDEKRNAIPEIQDIHRKYMKVYMRAYRLSKKHPILDICSGAIL